MHNLLIVSSEETVTRKHLGILCSAIAAYNRAMEQETTRAYEAKRNAESDHFGTVGKRETWEGVVLATREFEGQFGLKTMVKFGVGSNVAVWWASSRITFETGQTVTIKGTVKSHSVYRGAKQTDLSRCKVEVMETAS
jgi:hypothetical protein